MNTTGLRVVLDTNKKISFNHPKIKTFKMTLQAPPPPLSNLQIELLKLYSVGVSDETLLELKKIISKFLTQKMRDEADRVWIEKGYSEKNINEWLGKTEEE